jgi:ribosomal protein S18 acetylase RimI-like enzyme
VEIRRLSPSDAEACDAVLASLPYHFGDEGGQAECAEAVRSQPGFVAAADDGTVVGFITWRVRDGLAPEITWMAVDASHRRRGIGGALVERLVVELPPDAQYLVVTTLAEESEPDPPPDGYQTTRSFYRKHGFETLWRPDGWWNEENQAVVLVRHLGARRA